MGVAFGCAVVRGTSLSIIDSTLTEPAAERATPKLNEVACTGSDGACTATEDQCARLGSAVALASWCQ